jgi:hypothetical protein
MSIIIYKIQRLWRCITWYQDAYIKLVADKGCWNCVNPMIWLSFKDGWSHVECIGNKLMLLIKKKKKKVNVQNFEYLNLFSRWWSNIAIKTVDPMLICIGNKYLQNSEALNWFHCIATQLWDSLPQFLIFYFSIIVHNHADIETITLNES